MKLNERGLLVVLSGPSGVGKGTVRKALFDEYGKNLTYSISMTTRPMRPGEVNGKDYYFVTEDEFKKKIMEGGFLEYNYFCGNYYGTPMDEVEKALNSGKELILEIEVNGCRQVKEKMLDAVTIFIVPPSREALYERLKHRGTESDYQIQERINKANAEFGLAYQYDYIVVNDDVSNAADRISAIIRAEHARTRRSIYKYYELLEDEEDEQK